jgi:hypothetical protein
MENWARWARRHWREIMISHGVCSLEWISSQPRLHAKVCLSLGHLLPADIRVVLLPVKSLPDGHPLSSGRPMFSIGAPTSGCYWFGVNARADAADSERKWLIRICPSRTFALQEIPALVQELEMIPSNTLRRGNRA